MAKHRMHTLDECPDSSVCPMLPADKFAPVEYYQRNKHSRGNGDFWIPMYGETRSAYVLMQSTREIVAWVERFASSSPNNQNHPHWRVVATDGKAK